MYCELENTATWQTYKKSRSARGWREPGNKTLQRGRINGLVLFIRKVTDQEGRPPGKRQSGARAGKGGGLGSACFLVPLFLQLFITLHHTEPAQDINLSCSMHRTTLHYTALQCTTLQKIIIRVVPGTRGRHDFLILHCDLLNSIEKLHKSVQCFGLRIHRPNQLKVGAFFNARKATAQQWECLKRNCQWFLRE